MTGIFKFPTYEQHPIAAKLMPGGMNAAEFKALKKDIDEHGVLMPVTLFEGMVLDGWHRYRAAKESGCTFKEIEYKGKDPAGYITSVNVLRRKLSSLQRALVGAKLHKDHALTVRDVCEKLGISNEALNYVLIALNSGNVKLIKRLEDEEDFTRGMLREELYDLDLLDANGAAAKKVEAKRAPPVANSIFQQGEISAAAANIGLEDLGDTDGIDSKLNQGLAKEKRKTKKATDTAAQLVADQFKALMMDEKQTFLKMIWPEAQAIVEELGLGVTPLSALSAAVKAENKLVDRLLTKGAAKTAKAVIAKASKAVKV